MQELKWREGERKGGGGLEKGGVGGQVRKTIAARRFVRERRRRGERINNGENKESAVQITKL